MASQNDPGEALRAGAGAQPPVPAMPAVPRDDLYPGRPSLVVQSGVRHSLGWQVKRRAGASFVVARLSRLDTVKVIERFPLTEQGWADAWRVLSGRDSGAAAAIGATLAERETAQKATAERAALDAASSCWLRRVLFNGGSGGSPLARGKAYDLRFLGDRIMACPPDRVDALLEVPYRDIETVEVGGPGQIGKSAGEVMALTLGLGLVGALLGLVVLGLLGLLLGAVVFGLVGALIGVGSTKIETNVLVRAGDAEYYFLHTGTRPDALRIALSEPLRQISHARAPASGDPDQPAEPAPGSIPDQLSKLASLLQQDLISRDEFEHLKAKLIASS